MTTQTNKLNSLNKIGSIIFFLTLFYVLPLLGKPELILHWQVVSLAGICTILFATQPRLSFSESKQNKRTDRNTIWLIIVVSGLGQIISLIEWAYFYRATPKIIVTPVTETAGHKLPLPLEWEFPSLFDTSQNSSSFWIMLGASLLIAGTLFRLYSIKILGKYFSASVEIKDKHRIVSTGPFKLLRHPSYTGAYTAMLGSAIFLHSLTGLVILGIGMLFVYHLRIKAEEKTLIRHFKEEYLNYARDTWKMFPYLW